MDAPLTIPKVLPKVKEYLKKPGNETGGHLHCILEDKNVNYISVEYCKNQAHDAGDVEGAAIADMLQQMSATQRLKIAYDCWT